MKTMLKAVFMMVVVATNGWVFGQTVWYEKAMQIKPGQSTREHLERIFDSPTFQVSNTFKWDEQGDYETKWGKIFVSYSRGNCSDGSAKYDFNKGTITYFSFVPFKPVSLSKLKIDLNNFESERESDTPNWFHRHRDSGLVYTSLKGKLKGIEWSLTVDQLAKHSCVAK